MITSSRDEGHFLGQGARAQAVWDPLSQMSGLGKFGSCAVSVSVWEGFTLTPRRHTFRGPSKSEGSSLAPPRLPQTCPDSSPPPPRPRKLSQVLLGLLACSSGVDKCLQRKSAPKCSLRWGSVFSQILAP